MFTVLIQFSNEDPCSRTISCGFCSKQRDHHRGTQPSSRHSVPRSVVTFNLTLPSQVKYDLSDFEVLYLFLFHKVTHCKFCTTNLVYLVIIYPLFQSHWITLPAVSGCKGSYFFEVKEKALLDVKFSFI
jgi:hypothetical protein